MSADQSVDFNVSSPVNLRMCFDVEDEISSHSKHSSRSSPTPQKSIKKRINLSIRKVIWNSKRDSISTWPINSKHIENRNVKKVLTISLEPEIQFLLQLILVRFGSTSSNSHDAELDQLVQLAWSVQLSITRVGSASSHSPSSGKLNQFNSPSDELDQLHPIRHQATWISPDQLFLRRPASSSGLDWTVSCLVTIEITIEIL